MFVENKTGFYTGPIPWTYSMFMNYMRFYFTRIMIRENKR